MFVRIILAFTILTTISIIQFLTVGINENSKNLEIIQYVFGQVSSTDTSTGATTSDSSSTDTSTGATTSDSSSTDTSTATNDVSASASSQNKSTNEISSTASSSSRSTNDVGHKNNSEQSSKNDKGPVDTSTNDIISKGIHKKSKTNHHGSSNTITSYTVSEKPVTNEIIFTQDYSTIFYDGQLTLNGSSVDELALLPTEIKNSTMGEILIPPTTTTVNETSGQTVTALLSKIVPGKNILISGDDSSIPSYGGLKQIILPVSQTAKPIGEIQPKEYFVIETSNKIPSSIHSKNLVDAILYVSVSYAFEETGTGYDWGDPTTYSSAPIMTLAINKTNSDEIQHDTIGCPIIEAYTLNSGSWASNGLGEISSLSISQTQCLIMIQTQHFSKFAVSLKPYDLPKTSGPGQFGFGTLVTDLKSPSSSVLGKGNSVEPFSLHTLFNFFFPSFFASAEPVEGFSHIECRQGRTHVVMNGQYTNGETTYKLIFLKLNLLDRNGRILSSASDYILDLGSHETKSFQIVTRHHDNYDSCSVQIDQKFPIPSEFSIK